MGVKVATTYLHLPQSSYLVPNSPSSSQSAISLPAHTRRSCVIFPGTNLHRSRACNRRRLRTVLTRASIAGLDTFSDDEFSRRVQEIVMRFHLSEESTKSESIRFDEDTSDRTEMPEEIIPANIEQKVSIVQLPHSLRPIRRKMQWREAGESAYCSVKKAFSSMVFIIRELHSFTLQMREKLLYEDLQDIILRVHKEIHSSFVWLFQQVFSHTPTLMIYVMILLANYSVHSMAVNAAIASPPPSSISTVVDSGKFSFDSSTIKKTFSISSSGGNTASIGGRNGGGGVIHPPVSSGTEGDGESANCHRTEVPNGAWGVREEESNLSKSVQQDEEEMKLWNSIMDEAATARDTVIDEETVQMLVSPVTAEIESDFTAEVDYKQTEVLYETSLAQDPNNGLLLTNYAQFLYLVWRDYRRSDELFRKAVMAEPVDAETLNKYATFLWKAKKDIWGAEETYQKAISAEPTNSYYSANYAHFLWNTGGEDTCYPFNSDDS